MEMCSLRLPGFLLENLERESEELGFDSRSEYVRAILQQRDKIPELERPEEVPETERAPAEIDRDVQQLQERVDTLEAHLHEDVHETERPASESDIQHVHERIDSLEARLDEIESMSKIFDTVSEIEAEEDADDDVLEDDPF